MTTDKRNGTATVATWALMAALAACSRETSVPAAAVSAAQSPTRSVFALSAWALPTPVGASRPDLVTAPNGDVLLSWVESGDAGDALKFSRYAAGRWSAPRTIAQGAWFGNPSDTPHLRVTADGALWAQWLRKSTAAGHARDVVLTRSADGGATWDPPVPVNLDGTPTEHGFVALWPAAHDHLGLAWLDGRATGGSGHHGHGSHREGMTMLRVAVFDPSLQRSNEATVDASTCDCCQTDVATTPKGPLVVYRDRTADEIRDIVTVRLQATGWTSPKVVHADGWRMPACPINGPALASNGNRVAAAWYTAAADVPSIRVAFSPDGGEHFAAPLELDRGEAVTGRVDVALDSGAAWVTWLREDVTGQTLWLARAPLDGSRVEQRERIASLAGTGRGTGVPRMISTGGRIYVVWTEIVDKQPDLRGVVITGP